MTAQNKLEITGNLHEHSLAELLLETTESKLTGSFRLTKDKEKIIIYLNEGEVIYAVSNARLHRLFELLLREKKIYKGQLVKIENFVNDIELGKSLIEQLYITQEELDDYFQKQVEGIVRYSLTLNEGFWTFDPLIRIRDGINFRIDIHGMLLDFARSLSPEDVSVRFDLEKEAFGLNLKIPENLSLQTQEGFILSRFERTLLGINDLQTISGLPDKVTMQILYNLWLGGFIFRENWDSPFSDEYKANTLLTKVAVKKVEEVPEQVEDKTLAEVLEEHEKTNETEEVEVIEEELDDQTLLENYLKMIETSSNFYEALGLTPEANQSDIKKMYFKFAKKYHPDLFHSQTENNLNQQIQSAFSKVAQAYDTLKNAESRQVYDFKMRKELAQMEKSMQSNSTQEDINLGVQIQQAEDNFNKGFNLLLKEEYDSAVPFLARAVHLNKINAKYHVYYGKALSFDKKQSHKAEAELREAVALDENNPTFRLILAEFYIRIGLLKRAEGELNRLLTKFPNDKEAKALLDSLQEK